MTAKEIVKFKIGKFFLEINGKVHFYRWAKSNSVDQYTIKNIMFAPPDVASYYWYRSFVNQNTSWLYVLIAISLLFIPFG